MFWDLSRSFSRLQIGFIWIWKYTNSFRKLNRADENVFFFLLHTINLHVMNLSPSDMIVFSGQVFERPYKFREFLFFFYFSENILPSSVLPCLVYHASLACVEWIVSYQTTTVKTSKPCWDSNPLPSESNITPERYSRDPESLRWSIKNNTWCIWFTLLGRFFRADQ